MSSLPILCPADWKVWRLKQLGKLCVEDNVEPIPHAQSSG